MFNSQTSPAGLSVSKTTKTFSKFYRRHYELISKFNVGLRPFHERAFRNQNFMVSWFTNLRNLEEGMIFLFNLEKSLHVTDVQDIT